ncbi:MAG: type II toxin-antitoxin system VapC family toxin [Elainellaceae cyanobacterium]
MDTSAIAPFYWPEALSTTVEALLRQESQRILSALTVVELCSALSRRVRMNEITHREAQQIVAQFQEHLRMGFFRQIMPDLQHYQRAQQWLTQFNTPLRTLDALHLALAHSQTIQLVTADTRLASSARILDIPFQLLAVE